MPDWLDVLEIEQAAEHCRADALGDWYRDPWSWPEVRYVANTAQEAALFRLKKGGITAYQLLDVPKENFAIRPAVILDPLDRLIYQALVDRIARKLLLGLPPWVYGWRTSRTKGNLYAANDEEWESYVENVAALEELSRWALVTDIVSFFSNIEVDRVVEDIGTRGGSTLVTTALETMLHAWDQIPARGGLPQRSLASAVLANAYLQSVDDVLKVRGRLSRSSLRTLFPDGGALRWMDDIWLFGSSELTLRSVQIELQEAMRSLGMEMNVGKTNTLAGDSLHDAVQSMHHSGIDAALNNQRKNEQPLEELLERLLNAPAHASRTSIRFAATRIREHELFHLTAPLRDAAASMPHGADHLGRLFRSSEDWRGLGEWWVKYYRSKSGRVDWSVAQLGLMFPANELPPDDGILDAVVEQIASVGSLPMFSFAAHRLVEWAPDDARVLLRDAAKNVDSALHRRVIGLALNRLRVPRAELRKVLGQQETTALTLKMLEDRNFRPPPVARDFAGAGHS